MKAVDATDAFTVVATAAPGIISGLSGNWFGAFAFIVSLCWFQLFRYQRTMTDKWRDRAFALLMPHNRKARESDDCIYFV